MHTTDPIALRYLMTETIFDVGEPVESATGREQAVRAPEQLSAPLFPFYGENKRRYLFLTQEQQYEWMSDAALDAFIKTLAALKLTAADVAVLNVGALTALPSKEDLLSFFEPKVMVCLGLPPQSLGFEIPLSPLVADYRGITVFHTYAFDEMLIDAEKKRHFWTTIKTLLI
ncbi:hypothetical protein [Parapedobacter sp. DT-150]|uniref:hypothetical protein n=1 Tax=Parapedobacter sp. DT-150 TaxID=3396162 RepID=UPI003F1B6CAC